MKIKEINIQNAIEDAIYHSQPEKALTLITVYRHLDELGALSKEEEELAFMSSQALDEKITEYSVEKALGEYQSIQNQLDFGIEEYEKLDFIEGYRLNGIHSLISYRNKYGENQLDRMRLTLERSTTSEPQLIDEISMIIKKLNQQPNKGWMA